MSFIRLVLGKIILFWDRAFAPKSVARSEADMSRIAGNLRGLELYQYEACPFCVKVRRFMRAQGAAIPLRDAKTEPFRSELISGGGKAQVPCLKITQPNGSVNWLYESGDIISYLKTQMQL